MSASTERDGTDENFRKNIFREELKKRKKKTIEAEIFIKSSIPNLIRTKEIFYSCPRSSCMISLRNYFTDDETTYHSRVNTPFRYLIKPFHLVVQLSLSCVTESFRKHTPLSQSVFKQSLLQTFHRISLQLFLLQIPPSWLGAGRVTFFQSSAPARGHHSALNFFPIPGIVTRTRSPGEKFATIHVRRILRSALIKLLEVARIARWTFVQLSCEFQLGRCIVRLDDDENTNVNVRLRQEDIETHLFLDLFFLAAFVKIRI